MYVTGGIGSIKHWEASAFAFTSHHTDEGGCYNGDVCWHWLAHVWPTRLLHDKLKGDVGDVAESSAYNSSITTGMSVDGKAFTYVNQLASSAEEPCERFDWFECACCPPNVMRTIGCLQGYFFGTLSSRPTDLAIHQIFAGSIDYLGNKVHIRTAYPHDGEVDITVETVAPSATIWLRVPAGPGRLTPSPVMLSW